MRVVDTSAWIEWFMDNPASERIAAEIPPLGKFVVPTIVQFELSKWLRREVSDKVAESVVALSQECVVVPLDMPLAIAAAETSVERKLSAADAIIYATALSLDADLLTCDAHFKGLPGVIYIAKGAP